MTVEPGLAERLTPERRQRARPADAAVAPLSCERVDGREWDRMTCRFDGIVQEQLNVFSESRWPGATIDPLIFSDGARTVGGCLAMYRSLPAKLGGLAVVKWGPMLADAATPGARRDLTAMVESLIQRYSVEAGLMISVLPRAVPAETNPLLDHLKARGFSTGPSLAFPARYFVHIEPDDDAQRASFSQKWRYHLNKSDKQGLIFERYPTTALPVFQELYDAMLDRKQFPDHSAVHTLPALMGTPIEAVRPELFLVHYEGAAVAGAIIFTAGDTAVYLYGATNDRALPLKAGYFMHERIIAWLREHTRARWYDLGGTDGFEGLHRFKSGMVGKTGVISEVPPAMLYAHRLWPRVLGSSIVWGREARARLRQAVDRRQPH